MIIKLNKKQYILMMMSLYEYSEVCFEGDEDGKFGKKVRELIEVIENQEKGE